MPDDICAKLKSQVTDEEIRSAMFKMKAGTALGPDGYTVCIFISKTGISLEKTLSKQWNFVLKNNICVGLQILLS